jgi:hypothetical protein
VNLKLLTPRSMVLVKGCYPVMFAVVTRGDVPSRSSNLVSLTKAGTEFTSNPTRKSLTFGSTYVLVLFMVKTAVKRERAEQMLGARSFP